MKKTFEPVGIGLEDIICQSNITEGLSYCDRGAILLLYYRIAYQRTVSMWFQTRSQEFNGQREAILVHAGLFNSDNDYLGEAIFVREFCEKERNYRPWKLLPGKDERERYENGRFWSSQIKGLIVTVENPLHETLHLPGISLD